MSSRVDALLRRDGSPLYRQRREAWRRSDGRPPQVLGHRGAKHAAPENTLRAFDLALGEGAAGVELDVRMTGDGELVVLHDPELPAACFAGSPRPAIGELSASQLASVRLPDGERIPTLQEALDWQQDTGAFMNVELKGDVPSRGHVVRAACELLRRHGGDRILISSFYPRMLLECSFRLPDVPTAWLVHAEQRLLKAAPGWRWTGSAAVHPQVLDLSEARVAALRTGGAIVNVWTVNQPEDAVRLARWGVDGLITDAPGEILAALAQTAPTRLDSSSSSQELPRRQELPRV